MASEPLAAKRFGFELPDGRGITLIRAKFNARRWRGDVGIGHVRESDGRSKRWRCYQWPLGLINVYGRWGS